MIPIPDLLHRDPYATHDWEQLRDLLDLAFAGGAKAAEIGYAMDGGRPRRSPWRPEFFAADLFIDELVGDCFQVEVDGKRFPVNRNFLRRVLSSPRADREEIELRQGIVAELEDDEAVRSRVEQLYRRLFELTSMFRAPGDSARLDFNAYRYDILKTAKLVIDSMEEGFGDCRSGLRRLHDVGREIRASDDYHVLASLLDHVERNTVIEVDLHVGASGKLTGLEIKGVRQNRDNSFHRGRLQKLLEQARLLATQGKTLDRAEIAFRLVHAVYDQISWSLTQLVQLLGHLEVYLANRYFKRRAESRGLAVCLPEVGGGAIAYEELFNPLLLRQPRAPVPTSVMTSSERPVTLVTGPNSGGKTRFLQALGLAQLLAQCGLYAPAAAARVPVLDGLFVSLIEREAVDHEEGRLGRELERIRTMFEAMGPDSLVVVDELCSGTNPSEGLEVFRLVLRLLDRLRPSTFITTHFLDFARELAEAPPIGGLDFLQVEFDERNLSTYQFVPGVASTSLASVMAERMGVTFDQLSRVIDSRRGKG